MNLTRITTIVLFLTTTAVSFARTQSQDNLKPEIGKPCPEFKLNYVTHYKKKQVTLSDFSGQWLFLDFWFTGCSSCIKSLPKINELQNAFKGKIQFLLVGMNDRTNKNIEEVFEKLSVKQGLNVAAAYDTLLPRQWGIQSMPHIVVIDPNGVVRSITGGFDMTEEKIQDMLDGKPASFFLKEGIVRPEFELELTDTDGTKFPKNKILNHSVLTKWNAELIKPGYDLFEYVTFPARVWENGFTYVGVPLEFLYSVAYLGKHSGFLKFWGEPLYGKIYPYPVLQVQDSGQFQYMYSEEGGIGLYNYSLFIPADKVTMENIMSCMQQDLERVFSYHAVVEERNMPVWKLVAKPGAEDKIKTKGGPLYYDAKEGKSIAAGFTVRNVAMKDYMTYLCYYLNEKEKHPFIDATGITSNIDLIINADLTNLMDVKGELQKNGLDLILSTKRMKVLVIRDKK